MARGVSQPGGRGSGKINSAGQVRLDQLPGLVLGAGPASALGGSGAGTGIVEQTSGPASIPVAVGSTVAQLNASFSGGVVPDAAMGIIRVGIWPDVSQVELTYVGGAVGKWVQISFQKLIHMLDQGYLGLPNTGTTAGTNNATLGVVYAAAASNGWGAAAGNANQTGVSIEGIEYADLFYAAGLKIQARMQGFFAGNGVEAMTTIPMWFQRNSGDVPQGPPAGDSPRLGVPTDAIQPAAIEAANPPAGRCGIVSPIAVIQGGVEWRKTGWVDMPELASTTLSSAITLGGTTLAVASSTGFPASGNYTIQVESEQMLVTAGQGTNSWTVTRAQGGTSAAAHSSGTPASIITKRYLMPRLYAKQGVARNTGTTPNFAGAMIDVEVSARWTS